MTTSGCHYDPSVFPNATNPDKDAQLGRLKIPSSLGDANNDRMFNELISFGTPSFGLWDSMGKWAWDSGADFESITANLLPTAVNSNHG